MNTITVVNSRGIDTFTVNDKAAKQVFELCKKEDKKVKTDFPLSNRELDSIRDGKCILRDGILVYHNEGHEEKNELGDTCQLCDGAGKIDESDKYFGGTCPACQGSGKKAKVICPVQSKHCNGAYGSCGHYLWHTEERCKEMAVCASGQGKCKCQIDEKSKKGK